MYRKYYHSSNKNQCYYFLSRKWDKEKFSRFRVAEIGQEYTAWKDQKKMVDFLVFFFLFFQIRNPPYTWT